MLLVVLAGSCASPFKWYLLWRYADIRIATPQIRGRCAQRVSGERSFFWFPKMRCFAQFLCLECALWADTGACRHYLVRACLSRLAVFRHRFPAARHRRNLWQPHPVALDRTTLDRLVGQATAIRVYPFFACIRHANCSPYSRRTWNSDGRRATAYSHKLHLSRPAEQGL